MRCIVQDTFIKNPAELKLGCIKLKRVHLFEEIMSTSVKKPMYIIFENIYASIYKKQFT